MKRSREPAGWERGGGRSAELSVRARAGGGPVGNTPGTVRGVPRGSAIRLQDLRVRREICFKPVIRAPAHIFPSYGVGSHRAAGSGEGPAGWREDLVRSGAAGRERMLNCRQRCASTGIYYVPYGESGGKNHEIREHHRLDRRHDYPVS